MIKLEDVNIGDILVGIKEYDITQFGRYYHHKGFSHLVVKKEKQCVIARVLTVPIRKYNYLIESSVCIYESFLIYYDLQDNRTSLSKTLNEIYLKEKEDRYNVRC